MPRSSWRVCPGRGLTELLHQRFNVSPDFRTVFVAMPVGFRHFKWEHPNVDIGIRASHIWLGLRLKGLEPAVRLTEEDGRAVWRFSL